MSPLAFTTLVLTANINEVHSLQTVERSLRYKMNRAGPRTQPFDSPQTVYFSVVLMHSAFTNWVNEDLMYRKLGLSQSKQLAC